VSIGGQSQFELERCCVTELVRSEIGGRLPSARGMRSVANNVTTKANYSVFESASQDFQAIHSACDEFMEKNPGSHASAVNDPENCFTSFTIVRLRIIIPSHQMPIAQYLRMKLKYRR